MSRPLRIGLIALAIVGFLAVSALIARVLGAANDERNAAVALVEAERRGDADAVIAGISGCRADPSCGARMRALVTRLRGSGKVRVLRVDGPGARFALGSRTGTIRIAWRATERLPVVQCVRVRRSGDVLTGFDVAALSLSAPIGHDARCPGQPEAL